MVQTTDANGVVSFPNFKMRGPNNATTTMAALAIDAVSGHKCFAPLFDVLVTDSTASISIVTESDAGQTQPLFCPEPW